MSNEVDTGLEVAPYCTLSEGHDHIGRVTHMMQSFTSDELQSPVVNGTGIRGDDKEDEDSDEFLGEEETVGMMKLRL